MMQTVLDMLADLGAATTEPFWVPVLAWTVLTLPLWALLERTDRLHPLAEYRLAQVLLAALPIGIGVVSVAGMFPAATRSSVVPVQSVVVLPAIETTGAVGPAISWSWMHAVGLLTVGALAVGVVSVGRLALQIVAAGRVRKQMAAGAASSLRTELDRLADRLNVRRRVQLRTTPDAAVPLTLGGLHPMILVPERLTETTDALRMTLRHELVHIRRWDDCAQLAERLVAALFAAHPLVDRLRRQIAEARERACDAAVLDDGDTPASDYARLLTAFADGASPHRLGALSLSESPSSLPNRLTAMRSSMPSLLSSRLALGTALVAVGLSLTLGVVACSDSTGPSLSDDEGPDASSQSPPGVPHKNVDDFPELAGGMKALQESITYPEMAKEAGIEGRVIVQFVVGKDGGVTNPTVARGGHELLNEAALAAVKQQTFEPGRTEGEPVPVQMSLPVTFRLDDGPTDGSDGSSDDATGSGATPKPGTGSLLFEKAGIQSVRVLMNEEGDLLLDDEPVEPSNLTDAVRQRITEDAARAVLLYADGAPTDRVAAAEASLRALDLQKVYVRKVE